MTPAQIEIAARELAKMRGYDPDARAHYPLEPIGTCWEQMRVEVERFAQVGTAIAAALQHENPLPKRKKRLDKDKAHL